MIIGDANYTAFKNDTRVSVPVTLEGYWQVVLGALSRLGQQVIGSTNIPAIIDTGTTLILTDEDIATNYFSVIPGARCGPDGVCTGASLLYVYVESFR